MEAERVCSSMANAWEQALNASRDHSQLIDITVKKLRDGNALMVSAIDAVTNAFTQTQIWVIKQMNELTQAFYLVANRDPVIQMKGKLLDVLKAWSHARRMCNHLPESENRLIIRREKAFEALNAVSKAITLSEATMRRVFSLLSSRYSGEVDLNIQPRQNNIGAFFSRILRDLI